jgi:hypothetical protein
MKPEHPELCEARKSPELSCRARRMDQAGAAMLVRRSLMTVGLAVLAGCTDDRIGQPEHQTKILELDKSEMTRADIKIGGGELRVKGSSPKLLEADFDYNNPGWKPQVDYHSTGVRSDITISNAPGAVPHGKNNWNLQFNDSVLLDLVIQMGAGEAHLNLGSLNLRSVAINFGAGDMDLDLRGTPKRSYDVQINGGVGQASIHVPSTVGISATATGGIGEINVRGLEQRNGRWINPGHENSPVTIRLDVKGGVGQIDLVAE